MRTRGWMAGVTLLALLAVDLGSQTGPVRPPEETLGFRVGDDYKLADWPQITAYFEELGLASDRVHVEVVGQSTLKRPFLLVTITSPENHQRLAHYRQVNGRLADPRGLSPAAAEPLIAEGRSIIAITCSVHATEVAAAQMSMELAHVLATATTEEVQTILDNTILLLVPSLNPDGLDIVVDWYRKNLNTPFDGAPVPELYHHYTGHDNNRDWYMFTQAETRVLVESVYKRWHPQVLYDVHQMGNSGARLFVPPFLDPYEPNVDPLLIQGAAFIGQAMMNRLIGEGKTGVATNAIYDAWTPARAYQHYHGAVRVLSEAASVRYASPIRQTFSDLRPGLGYDPRTISWKFPAIWRGGDWRLRDIVDYELTAAMGALEHMARYRERWLRNFYRVGRNAMEWRGAPFAFLVPPDQRDPATAIEMLDVLQFGEVEVHRAEAPFTADGVEYPAGTYVIPMAQPYGSFAKTLLERQVYPDLREYPGGPLQRPYDVVAHTLPLQMGVHVVEIREPFSAPLAPPAPLRPPPGTVGSGPASAYVLSHDTNASFKALNRLVRDGVEVVWTADSLRVGTTIYEAGAMVVPVGPGVEGRLRAVAAELPVVFQPIPQPVEARGYRMHLPRIALYKSYVASMDEGWTRFILEEYGFPFTNIANADVRSGRLRSRFDVIVIPGELSENDIVQGHRPGSAPPQFAGGIGESGVQHLRDFVNDGGTLVVLDEATLFAINRFALPVRNVLESVPAQQFYIPGSLLRLVVDPDHPIAYGMPRETAAFFLHNQAFELNGNARSIAAYPLNNPLLSGWVLGHERLHGRTAVAEVPLGRGRVILMGIRPQFRAQVRVTYKLLFNALYYGAATPVEPAEVRRTPSRR